VTIAGENGSKKRTDPIVIIYDEDFAGCIRRIDGLILQRNCTFGGSDALFDRKYGHCEQV
jgi:hypothetical protein